MSRAGSHSRWLVRRRPSDSCRLRLVLFPFAGGGASAYSAWSTLVPPDVEVVCVQPPGREERLGEPPLTSAAVLGEQVVAALEPLNDRPMAFFGHSMGALLAFDVTQRRRALGAGSPTHLFVSSCRAPHLGDAWEDPRSLSDERLAHRLLALEGTPSEVLEHPELLALVLPTVRSDLTLTIDFQPFAQEPVDCPVVALGGAADPHVSTAELDAWSAYTRGEFCREVFPGGHFYLQESAHALVSLLAGKLENVEG